MKLRNFFLPLFLAGTLSLIYFLPSAGKIAQSAVIMELPKQSEKWFFKVIPASDAELGTLAKDTEFSKAVCFRPRPGEFDVQGNQIPDRIDLSVVLSGVDINNSIHRPERCMPAQGHQILESADKSLRLKNGREITVKRLRSVQRLPINEEGTEHLELNCVTYYFFVGHDSITNDHLGRTFIDIKDRLLKGMDQRWAYVSTSMWFGEMPWMKDVNISEDEVDEKLSKFVGMFAEEQIDWNQIDS
ncbi:MAG: exosortase-associated EpsI family protein [Akkermansiaceae bacterium]